MGIKDRIESVFNALQDLDIKATPRNVSILCGVFDVLKDIYQNGLEVSENGGKDGTAADSDGRDDH